MILIQIYLFLSCFLLFVFSMEKLKTKKIMTAAERKRKSRENKFKKITEEMTFKETEKERLRKAVQTHRSKRKTA